MNNRLFVGGLPWAADDQDLREAFSQYGNVTDCKVVLDRETNRSRGFGFVTFETEDQATAAIEGMEGGQLGGRNVTVKVAQERRPRTPGGYGHRGGGGYTEERRGRRTMVEGPGGFNRGPDRGPRGGGDERGHGGGGGDRGGPGGPGGGGDRGGYGGNRGGYGGNQGGGDRGGYGGGQGGGGGYRGGGGGGGYRGGGGGGGYRGGGGGGYRGGGGYGGGSGGYGGGGGGWDDSGGNDGKPGRNSRNKKRGRGKRKNNDDW